MEIIAPPGKDEQPGSGPRLLPVFLVAPPPGPAQAPLQSGGSFRTRSRTSAAVASDLLVAQQQPGSAQVSGTAPAA